MTVNIPQKYTECCYFKSSESVCVYVWRKFFFQGLKIENAILHDRGFLLSTEHTRRHHDVLNSGVLLHFPSGFYLVFILKAPAAEGPARFPRIPACAEHTTRLNPARRRCEQQAAG